MALIKTIHTHIQILYNKYFGPLKIVKFYFSNFGILLFFLKMISPKTNPKSDPKLQKMIECHSNLIFMNKIQKPPLAVPEIENKNINTKQLNLQ